MSAGKEAARDTRYGRRGGRWANGQRADEALAAIATVRAQTIEAHRLNPKNPPWPDLTSMTFEPSTDEEWEGRARMARAREAAGVFLDHIDRQAIRRVATA